MKNSEIDIEKKNEKIATIVTRAAAMFFELEADKTSMITVTHTEIMDRGKRAIIYITVFPEDKEADALAFSKRKRSDLHAFLTKETGLNMVPFVDVLIDIGEKNRQKLETLK